MTQEQAEKYCALDKHNRKWGKDSEGQVYIQNWMDMEGGDGYWSKKFYELDPEDVQTVAERIMNSLNNIDIASDDSVWRVNGKLPKGIRPNEAY